MRLKGAFTLLVAAGAFVAGATVEGARAAVPSAYVETPIVFNCESVPATTYAPGDAAAHRDSVR